MLRLYAADTLPGELVTPLRARGRKPAPPPSVATQFLDAKGTVKVPTRESFVGRRCQLQQCLKALTQSPDEVGVLIHGMGGLGKSSLAARLCDRLLDFERVVWVGRIDEASLVSRLADKLEIKELREALVNSDEELTSSPPYRGMGIPKNHYLGFLVAPLRAFGTCLAVSHPGSTPAQAVSVPRLSTGTRLSPRNNTISAAA